VKFDTKHWTYGVELEYGNCDRKIKDLPEGAKWNTLDNTCVSSTGIANDPQGKLYEFGGEINTKPTSTSDEQVEHIAKINKFLRDNGPSPIVNYRSNLHIHIRVPGLKDDLKALKQLLTYINTYQEQAFAIVENIPVPDRNTLPPLEYTWAKKRYDRRLTSHQHKLPQKRVEAMLAATTPTEFWHEHAHKDAKGNPAWFQCPRAGINLRQLFEETNTIEFRHFPGTLKPGEMRSAINWCHNFLQLALHFPDTAPGTLLETHNYTFPQFEPYEFETEQVYQYTNFDKNSRKVVADRLTAIRQRIDIDDMTVSSKQVYDVILDLERDENEQESFFE
jgi:hypothetical protein